MLLCESKPAGEQEEEFGALCSEAVQGFKVHKQDTSSCWERRAMVRMAEALVSIIMSSSKRSSSTRNSASSYWFFRMCCNAIAERALSF